MTIKLDLAPAQERIDAHINTLLTITGTQLAQKQTGKIGNPVTHEIAVTTSDRENLVWIHEFGQDAASTQPAFNGLPGVPLYYGMPVQLEREVNGYKVVGVDSLAYGEFMRGATNAHDQQPVLISQIMWGTLQPTPTPSMQCFVVGAFYDGEYWVSDQYTADMSASPNDTSGSPINIPSTNTRAIAVLVQVNPSTETLEYKQSAEFDAAIPLKSAAKYGLLPARDVDRHLAGFIKLVKGVTALTQQELFTTPGYLNSTQQVLPTAPTVITGTQTIPAGEQLVLGELTVTGELIVEGALYVL